MRDITTVVAPDKKIIKIAMPKIGCGLDKLDWEKFQKSSKKYPKTPRLSYWFVINNI